MIAPGTAFSEIHSLTQRDFDRFARISGDDNPIHVDADFSARTRFGRTVAHGMLLYTVLWGMLRRAMPVKRQLAQRLMFPNPAYADEPLRFSVRLEDVDGAAARVALLVERLGDGAVACEGDSEIELGSME